MEPHVATGSRVVPKLHLLAGGSETESRFEPPGSYTDREARQRQQLQTPVSPLGAPASARLPHRPWRRQMGATPRSSPSPMVGKVLPTRVSAASVEYLESPVLPPMQLRPAVAASDAMATTPTSSSSSRPTLRPTTTEGGSNNLRESEAEFQVLHPVLDELADEHSEDLARLMLSRWSIHAGEEQFASISLFCEMKLNEAKRMASWAEAPNRFYTVVCCQLLEKYISRLATHKGPRSEAPGGLADAATATAGQSITFLRRILAEFVTSIFLPPTQTQAQEMAARGDGDSGNCDALDYEHRTPYFTEYKRLRRSTQALVATVQDRGSIRTTRQRLPGKVGKLVRRLETRRDRQSLALIFRGWAGAMAAQREIRVLKCRAFQAMRKTNLTAWFRVWRVEALRRAYQRESADYQTMLSVTAASLSRKDIVIAEAEAKVTSMARIIDSLTESNKQLSHRVDQLENLASATAASGGAGGRDHSGTNGSSYDFGGDDSSGRQSGNGTSNSGRSRPEAHYDRIDTLLSQDDERMDRTNRMLLETMFGMARMVETCAIQMSKEVMDSLEYQLDGSILQHLAEMIQTENALKAKADAAEGAASWSLQLGKGAGGRTTAAVASSSTTNAARPVRARAVTIRDLAQMPIDALLLYWFRMHLSLSSSVEKPGDRTIKNFTSDLADGRRFSFLLHRLFPTWFDASMVHELDTDQRLRNVAEFHARVQPPLPQVVTSDSIHAASATENVAFVAMLFGSSVGCVRKLNLEKQRGDFLSIVTSWRRVRGLLLEVKRMNDNYDALMVVHLLKEMRTCETLFKQLHGELAHIAVASNEASSALSQIAYKALSLTWSCVRARDVHPQAPLALVDERTHERVREFSCVDSACVRELLVRDSESMYQQQMGGGSRLRRTNSVTASVAVAGSFMVPVVPERDVEMATDAVRRVLLVYSKDLHDIFKHYSASGGAGSLAAMSLQEYNKLIKDCFTGDKRITAPVAEAVYNAALQPEQLVPTTGDSLSKPGAAEATVATASTFGTADGKLEEERELSGRQFADALLRLATIKYVPPPPPRPPAGAAVPAPKPSPPLPLDERFRLLMEQDLLPHALRSQSELFRAEVASPKVREIFQRHKPALQRVFRYYASMHALREQQSTLSLRAFTVLARDCKLVGSFVTEHTLKQVLVNLQNDDGGGGDALSSSANTEAELELLRADFGDFQEALAALTEYVVCNPYVPLHKRIEHFLQEMLLPRARQKK